MGTAKEPSLYSCSRCFGTAKYARDTQNNKLPLYGHTDMEKGQRALPVMMCFYSSSPSGLLNSLGNEIYQDKKNGTQPLFVCDYALLIDDTSDGDTTSFLNFQAAARKKGYQGNPSPAKQAQSLLNCTLARPQDTISFQELPLLPGYDWELYLCMSSYFYGDTHGLWSNGKN